VLNRTTTHHWPRIAVASLATVALLAACAKPPVIEPPPPPVSVAVDVTASVDANPDPDGRASPVTVRLHQLSDDTAYGKADLLTLWNDEAATLGAASAGRYEILLAPGGSARADFKLDPATRSIGVAAAFRDYRGATWKTNAPLPGQVAPGSTIRLIVTVGRDAVSARWQ